jgi:hypothetical protein
MANDEEDERIELWVMRDSPLTNELEIICQTLYNVRIKKHTNIKLTKDWKFNYNNLWQMFGVDRNEIDRAEFIMFASMILDSLYLNMPTMGK